MENITHIAIYSPESISSEELYNVSDSGVESITKYLNCSESDLVVIYSTNFHTDEIYCNEDFNKYGEFSDMTEVQPVPGKGCAYFGKGQLMIGGKMINAVITCDASPYAFIVNSYDILDVEVMS